VFKQGRGQRVITTMQVLAQNLFILLLGELPTGHFLQCSNSLEKQGVISNHSIILL
jgi:hypothetical protein